MKRKLLLSCVAVLFAWTGIKAQAPISVTYGFGDEITSLDELASGVPFIMAYENNDVLTFGGDGYYCQKVNFSTLDQSSAYCVYKLEHESDMGDGYYRIRVQNFTGTDFPNGRNSGVYMGRKSDGEYRVISGRSQASGADYVYGEGNAYYSIWKVKFNEGSGFSFYHDKAAKPRYLGFDGNVVTLSGEHNFKLYKVQRIISRVSDLAITGSEFQDVTRTWQKATKVSDKLFDIDFDWVALREAGWESLVVKFDFPTTGGDWMLLQASGDYTDYKTIGPGTKELEYALTKRNWTRLVLETGNNASGYDWPRYVAFDGLYIRKTVDGEVVEQKIDVSGATVTEETLTQSEASSEGTKAFEKTNLDVSAYDALTFNFTLPNYGKWIVEYDGQTVTIPSGTKTYSIDVSNINVINSIVLKTGSGDYPRINSLESVILSKEFDNYVSDPVCDPADGGYIQPGQTVNVTFETISSDPSATLTKNFSGVTFDGSAVVITETDNGFSFTVPETLQPGTDNLTLSIPAGVIGYASLNTFNEAKTITYHTPAVFDGVYYFRNTDPNYAYKYLSRGGSWSTQAIMGDYGLATHVKTDANNKTTIQLFDNNMYIGDDGFCYTDCTNERVRQFTVEKVSGGYKFKRTNTRHLAVFQGQVVADGKEGDNLEGTTNVWALETTAEYTPTYARNTEKLIVAVATAAGLSGITTGAQLEAALDQQKSIEIPEVPRNRSLNEYAPNIQEGGVFNIFEKEVTGLANGVYKLTFKAMQRGAWYDMTDAAEGARGLVYIYANDYKKQLMSVMEQGASSNYSANYHSDRTGLNYPDNSSSSYAAFDAGLYADELWVYVNDGTLKFGINNPSRLGGDFNTYVVYGDFSLTYYYSLSSLQNTLAETAAAANVTPLPTQAAADLQDVVTEYNKTYTTMEEYQTAIDAISEATTTAKAVSAVYSDYLTLKPIVEAIPGQEVYTDLDGAVAAFNTVLSSVDAPIQAAALNDAQGVVENKMADIRTALKTFLSSVIVNDGAYFDLTSLMVNPEVNPMVGSSKKAEGWTEATNRDLDFASYQYTQFPGSSSNPHFNLYQVVTDMPAGMYKVKAHGFHRPGAFNANDMNTVANTDVPSVIYLNDTQQALLNICADGSPTPLSKGKSTVVNGNTIYIPDSRSHLDPFFEAGYYWNEMPALIAEDGNLTIGVKYDSWVSGGWGVISDFHLYYYGLTVDENKEWDATIAGNYNLALKRTISATNINTLVLPFSMTAEEVAEYFGNETDAEGEGPVVYVVGSYANDNIKLTKKTDGISANQPVLLKATKAGTYYKLTNRTLEAIETDPKAQVEGLDFVGVYEFTEGYTHTDGKGRFVVPVGSYIVSNNQFRHVEKEGTAVLKSTRAYFTLTDNSGSGIKALTLSFDDDEATGIATVEDGQLNILTGKVYDLSGREVKNPTKGLYIIDGKKVMIK